MRRAMVVALAMVLVAGGCRREGSGAGNLATHNRVAVRPVRLYFEAPQMLLVPESRNIALPENPAAAIPLVVRELLKGPATPALARLYPADTIVRGTYLLPDGTVLVDLGGATLTEGWGTGSHQELMAVYSLVHTVIANFADAKRVRLLLNGGPVETLGGHVWLSRSLVAAPSLNAPQTR